MGWSSTVRVNDDPLELAREALRGEAVWLVGGAVRDRLDGRESSSLDVDLIIGGDAEQAARTLAAAGGRGIVAFSLSDQFGAWRVSGADVEWQIDCTAMQAETLEQDLNARDLTINAIAEPLAGGPLIDPTGGQSDLKNALLRMPSAAVFEADPLRSLRLVRFHGELGFEVDEQTAAAARAAAPRLDSVAAERIFAELNRTINSDRAVSALRMLDQIGAMQVVLPELRALQGVEQTAYHHLDAYDHTLEVLQQVIGLEAEPASLIGDSLASDTALVLSEPLADSVSRGNALRWGALLHDIAKPQTRTIFEDQRVGFPNHASEGAVVAGEIMERLRTSERLRTHVASLTREHLRLGFLVHEGPVTAQTLYRYITTCEPVEVDVTLLSLADRMATRGRKSEQAIALHMSLALEVLEASLEWRRSGAPVPLLKGDELAEELGIPHGPQLGALIAAITEGQYCGTVASREQAIALANQLIADGE
jgi:putative nucleotidyltransferase with HDIG domain